MNTTKKMVAFDIVEHEKTAILYIVAFGKIVSNAPTFAVDQMAEARQYCDELNAAFHAGVTGSDIIDKASTTDRATLH